MSRRTTTPRSLRLPKGRFDLQAAFPHLTQVPGWEAYSAKQLEEAIRATGRELQRTPESGRAWELLGLEMREVGRTSLAVDALERATLIVPLHPYSRTCLAECYAVLERRELARDLYASEAEIADTDADPERLLAIATGLDGINESEMALDLARRATKLDPDSGQAFYDLCYYSMRCGCSAHHAESLCWHALELEPNNVDFRIGLASLLVRLGKADRACLVLRKLERDCFAQVSCRCCLERIADLYRLAGDHQQLASCKERLARLEMHEEGLA